MPKSADEPALEVADFTTPVVDRQACKNFKRRDGGSGDGTASTLPADLQVEIPARRPPGALVALMARCVQ
jgi:hypothetical protein